MIMQTSSQGSRSKGDRADMAPFWSGDFDSREKTRILQADKQITSTHNSTEKMYVAFARMNYEWLRMVTQDIRHCLLFKKKD